jgi:hypothetical protein
VLLASEFAGERDGGSDVCNAVCCGDLKIVFRKGMIEIWKAELKIVNRMMQRMDPKSGTR